MHAYDVFVYVLRWVLAVVLAGLGWGIIVANLACVYVWLVRREHHSMMLIPAVAGSFALVGMVCCPVPQVQRLAWIPLVVDVGFFLVVMLAGLLMQLCSRIFKGKKHDP